MASLEGETAFRKTFRENFPSSRRNCLYNKKVFLDVILMWPLSIKDVVSWLLLYVCYAVLRTKLDYDETLCLWTLVNSNVTGCYEHDEYK